MKNTELEQLPPEAFEDPSGTDEIFPFLFPKMEERLGSVPMIIAQRWKDSSHYWFFYNGLCSQYDIRKFLRAQPMDTLDSIAASFDIEPIDLVSEKRKKEGTTVTDADRDIIIDAIISSITT